MTKIISHGGHTHSRWSCNGSTIVRIRMTNGMTICIISKHRLAFILRGSQHRLLQHHMLLLLLLILLMLLLLHQRLKRILMLLLRKLLLIVRSSMKSRRRRRGYNTILVLHPRPRSRNTIHCRGNLLMLLLLLLLMITITKIHHFYTF